MVTTKRTTNNWSKHRTHQEVGHNIENKTIGNNIEKHQTIGHNKESNRIFGQNLENNKTFGHKIDTNKQFVTT